ncbi:NAD(P)/FAD-dependent oxidoreductase [Rugosimonospora africana]|uniref:Thioredoxin reductase n=1 Tax=Rugosimonospora africana TaxID=556532 RepID=A0A8J3QVC4_9ACTN|nr:NAD(P)/FAD-dependent oxidoreductase [Rugosimonospora africana]GIH16463.1 thioredoxin reductase [Rugosimonospora africana]
MRECDVVIVGGSVAGLQAALTLGRARRRVVVIDDGRPRNGPAHHVHNFLGQPSVTPADLLESGRRMLAPYDVTLVDDRVENIRVEDAGTPRFEATTRRGERWSGRSVVLATGLTDELPDVPGVARGWGDRVVACPHCHGWEVRDQPLAQLGMRGLPARGVARALLLSRWSADVVLFTDGDDLDREDRIRLEAAGVRVDTGRVDRVEAGTHGVDVVQAGGRRTGYRALFVVTRQHQQSDLAARLGCQLVADGARAGAAMADPDGRTSVPGVWAAGTTAFPALLAIGAAGHASTVATAVHAALIDDDIAAAMTAWPRPAPPSPA